MKFCGESPKTEIASDFIDRHCERKLNFQKRRVSGTPADSLVSSNLTGFGWVVSSTVMLIDKDIKLTRIDGISSTTKKRMLPNFRFEVKFDFAGTRCVEIFIYIFLSKWLPVSRLICSTSHVESFTSRNKFHSSTVTNNKSHINVTWNYTT